MSENKGLLPIVREEIGQAYLQEKKQDNFYVETLDRLLQRDNPLVGKHIVRAVELYKGRFEDPKIKNYIASIVLTTGINVYGLLEKQAEYEHRQLPVVTNSARDRLKIDVFKDIGIADEEEVGKFSFGHFGKILDRVLKEDNPWLGSTICSAATTFASSYRSDPDIAVQIGLITSSIGIFVYRLLEIQAEIDKQQEITS